MTDQAPEQPSITCPDPACAAISYNPNDIRFEYCGACHRYHARLAAAVEEGLGK